MRRAGACHQPPLPGGADDQATNPKNPQKVTFRPRRRTSVWSFAFCLAGAQGPFIRSPRRRARARSPVRQGRVPWPLAG
jgi:hypothetical protein